MDDQILHEAYERVRRRYGDEIWFALPPHTVTDAIYREIQQIDAERLEVPPPNTSMPVAPMPISNAEA